MIKLISLGLFLELYEYCMNIVLISCFRILRLLMSTLVDRVLIFNRLMDTSHLKWQSEVATDCSTHYCNVITRYSITCHTVMSLHVRIQFD